MMQAAILKQHKEKDETKTSVRWKRRFSQHPGESEGGRGGQAAGGTDTEGA